MGFPFLGFGIGLRKVHYNFILKNRPCVDFFEVLSENYMVPGGRPLWILDQIRERYPVVMHGVSLSIGSSDPPDHDYLKSLKKLARRIRPAWISDHLCWTGVQGKNAHDLLPLPYTEEAVRHVVRRVRQIQDFLGRQILLENVSSYMTFTQSTMEEWEFLVTIADEADCGILLDINNIYVSSINHSFDPIQYIDAVPLGRVGQFHLAGHRNKGNFLLDTHDHPVKKAVWDLYRYVLRRFGAVSTLIEWDENIPSFPRLQRAAEQARGISQEIYESKVAPLKRNSSAPLEAHLSA